MRHKTYTDLAACMKAEDRDFPLDETGGRGMRAPLAGSKPPVQTGDVCDLELNSPQIIDHGSTLQVVGLVDRKGLERLIKKLSAYKAVLDVAYLDDEEDDGLGQ